MTEIFEARWARGLAFVAFNVLVALLAWVCIVWPIAARFNERADLISERQGELDRATLVVERVKALSAGARDPFMVAPDERVASADLQAILQRMVDKAGAKFLGVQGVAPQRDPGHRMVQVRLSVDGFPSAIRALLQDIETTTPLMFVDAAVLRSVGETPMAADMLHAEFVVQATLKQGPTPRSIGLRGDVTAASMQGAAP